MRQGPNGRRPRGRPNRKQHGGPSRPNTFDSAGPEGRVRGNAHQVYEKYVTLARDAMSSGDRIMAEAFFQHAEHYFRIVNASTDPEPAERRPPRAEAQGREGARHDGNGRDGEGRETFGRDQGGRDQGGRDQGRRAPNGQSGQGQSGQGQSGQGRDAWAQGPDGAAASQPQSPVSDAQDEAANGGAKDARPQPPAPRAREEDREGLDRVLGNDKTGPRRRPRRAPARPQQEAAEGTPEPRPQPAYTEQPYPASQPQPESPGDGESDTAQVQAAGTKANGTEAASPGESKPDSEPVGA